MTQPDPSAQSGAGAPQSGAPGGSDLIPPVVPPTGASGTGVPPVDPNAGKTAREIELEQQVEAHRTRMSAADRTAAQAQAELKQLKEKDLPEAEKLQRDRDEAVARADKAEADLTAERIRNAFLTNTKHAWNDPKVALSQIDTSKLEIDAEGNVIGLDALIEGVAKTYPWMLKAPAEGDPGAQTGVPPMNGRPPATGAPNKAEQLKRFPAMRSRLG